MTTYYTIQSWKGEMLDSETFNLYETFDEACDTIEGYMKAYVDFDQSYLEKIRSNREEKRKNIESWNRVAYLKMPSGEMKYITRMTVIPKKKSPLYYFKAVSTDGRVIVSQDFPTFDEAFTLLEQTIRNHETYKYEHWKPSMTREQLKEELENKLSVEYARFDHDEPDTIVYDLKKKMV